MRQWAVFYKLQHCPIKGMHWHEPCGDRRIVQLDGRLGTFSRHEVAKRECKARGFDGYRLARGERLDNLFMLTAAVQALTN